MAQITAALVKELRDKSGAGMMDCKKALAECDGNLEEAVDWLRTKGLAAAAKKSGRVAVEGLVGVAVGEKCGAMVEVNSETDFVARNDSFQSFVKAVSELALANEGDMDAVMAAGYPDSDRTVTEQLTENVATIGENQSVRRMAALSVSNGVVTSYVHNAVAPNLGKIGVLVALESDADTAVLEGLGKQIAMHIAATNPASLDVDDLDPEIVEREKQVQIETARESGKPEDIIMKMIEGRMRKFYEEVCLMKQTSVIDGETKIADLVAGEGKNAGVEIKLAAFLRFQLGEGMEKKEDNFAEEVKAAAGV